MGGSKKTKSKRGIRRQGAELYKKRSGHLAHEHF